MSVIRIGCAKLGILKTNKQTNKQNRERKGKQKGLATTSNLVGQGTLIFKWHIKDIDKSLCQTLRLLYSDDILEEITCI